MHAHATNVGADISAGVCQQVGCPHLPLHVSWALGRAQLAPNLFLDYCSAFLLLFFSFYPKIGTTQFPRGRPQTEMRRSFYSRSWGGGGRRGGGAPGGGRRGLPADEGRVILTVPREWSAHTNTSNIHGTSSSRSLARAILFLEF